MIRSRVSAALIACLLLAGCASNAFDDIEGEEPTLPPEVNAPAQLNNLRSLGEYGDVTYVAAKADRDSRCLVMYRTREPAKFVVACGGAWVNAGGEGLGEATFYSEGIHKQDSELNGEQVNDWLVINSRA